jgi:cell division protein DivIC
VKFSEFKQKKWVRFIGNKYVLILALFLVWMLFFDTNSILIHEELNDDIEALENNMEFYKEEIKKDKIFIEKMKDSNEIEKFAREKYFLKKENEDIFIIEHQDSLKNSKENE